MNCEHSINIDYYPGEGGKMIKYYTCV